VTDTIAHLVETSARIHLEVIELRRLGHHALAAELTAAAHSIYRLIQVLAQQEVRA
jgi:hypothetical protein